MQNEPTDIFSQLDLLASLIFLHEQREFLKASKSQIKSKIQIKGSVYDLKIKYWYAIFLGIIAITTQLAGFYIILNSSLVERKFDLLPGEEFLLRLFFALVLQRVIGKQFKSVDFSNSILELKLFDGNFLRMSVNHFLTSLRLVFYSFVQVLATYFLLSTRKESRETNLELMMNFVALMILSQMDQMLCVSGMTDCMKDIKGLDSDTYLYLRFKEKQHCNCCFVTVVSWISWMVSYVLSKIFQFSA